MTLLPDTETLKKTALFDQHIALGARSSTSAAGRFRSIIPLSSPNMNGHGNPAVCLMYLIWVKFMCRAQALLIFSKAV